MNLLSPVRYTLSFAKDIIKEDSLNGLFGCWISLAANRSLEIDKRVSILYQSCVVVILAQQWVDMGKRAYPMSFSRKAINIINDFLHAQIRYFLLKEGLRRGFDLPLVSNQNQVTKFSIGLIGLMWQSYLAGAQTASGR
ncbi:MAG: hypothetical protein FJZ62_04090 [Chlamydiae bacterium]|nr:hypothetical protein [Chlamydiota bacterium]